MLQPSSSNTCTVADRWVRAFPVFCLFVLSKLTLKQMCDSTIVGTLSHRPLLKVVNSHLFKPMADQFRLLLALLFCFSLKRHNFVSPL